MVSEPLAHSRPSPDREPHTYRAHIGGNGNAEGVAAGARRRAEEMLRYYKDKETAALVSRAVLDGATFHDLGKLDPEIQSALARDRRARLPWDHVDAGVAHLMAYGAQMAAWMVRAHHAPGLPSRPTHFSTRRDRRLRGRRDDASPLSKHEEQITRTDAYIAEMLALHRSAVGYIEPTRGKPLHGLSLRLALSCLVDADHSDAAHFDSGWRLPESPAQRWPERLAALDAYVARLGLNSSGRSGLRRDFYDACRSREPDEPLASCEGPVGIGKTTAVTAYLLRRAIATKARRLFIVAPYTAILSQTASRLREAITLPDEYGREELVVAEHHHRADFSDISARDLATLWTSPVVVTTSVQFFETLSSNQPAILRKLHGLPGSVVFLDEAHAALPVSGSRRLPSQKTSADRVETPILPQNWMWVCELVDSWSCSFVLASGSLARFWEIDDIVGSSRRDVPELTPTLAHRMQSDESQRIRYKTLGRIDGPKSLADAVIGKPGPRLLIMNTVQSAAVMARNLRESGHDTLHISTALTPTDRNRVLSRVADRLHPDGRYIPDWTLVATSLMEAGVDFSFRTPLRERATTASLIQIGGRGNRNFEWPDGVDVYDFLVDHVDRLSAYPGISAAADVLTGFFDEGLLSGEVNPAEIVTRAMAKEMRRLRKFTDHLSEAEREANYPDVASLGRVIDADTRLVVVDRVLRDRISDHDRISTKDLLAGSVQLWASKIESLGLQPIREGREIFWWPHAYDPDFLGFMEGALRLTGDTSVI